MISAIVWQCVLNSLCINLLYTYFSKTKTSKTWPSFVSSRKERIYIEQRQLAGVSEVNVAISRPKWKVHWKVSVFLEQNERQNCHIGTATSPIQVCKEKLKVGLLSAPLLTPNYDHKLAQPVFPTPTDPILKARPFQLRRARLVGPFVVTCPGPHAA